jgi:DNA-binding SARP family transcriptional activator
LGGVFMSGSWGTKSEGSEMGSVTRCQLPLRLTIIAAAVGLLTFVPSRSWIAGATIEQTDTEQIDQSFEVLVTNNADGVTLTNVMTAVSVTLDTLNPDGSGTSAPAGKIYLSLQVSSGPPQVPTSNPNWGHYFSNMTPVSGSAWRFVASSGINYVATRVNPVDQANNLNGSSDDGMVDATYYFTVPLSTRAGTVEFLPTRTLGVEYSGFVGAPPVVLDVGGPIKIPVRFAANLTVVTTTTSTTTTTNNPWSYQTPTGSSGSSSQQWLVALLVLLLLFIGGFEVHRRRGLSHRISPAPPFPDHTQGPPHASSAHNAQSHEPTPPFRPAPSPPPENVTSDVIVDTSTNSEVVIEETRELRVNILGPLSITPTLTTPSDPVRAIVAYLAMNADRPLSMDEIQNAVWPLTTAGSDIKRPVMRNYMSDVRRCVGENHLPSAAGRQGYQLVSVGTDWDEFQRLVAQSATVPKADAIALKVQALAMVAGPPFTADTSRYFTWAFSASVVYQIISTVTNVAHDVSSQLIMAGDLKGAEAALRRGLLIEPASLPLWEDLTDVLLETSDQSLMAIHWTAAALVLRPDDVTALRARQNG